MMQLKRTLREALLEHVVQNISSKMHFKRQSFMNLNLQEVLRKIGENSRPIDKAFVDQFVQTQMFMQFLEEKFISDL